MPQSAQCEDWDKYYSSKKRNACGIFKDVDRAECVRHLLAISLMQRLKMNVIVTFTNICFIISLYEKSNILMLIQEKWYFFSNNCANLIESYSHWRHYALMDRFLFYIDVNPLSRISLILFPPLPSLPIKQTFSFLADKPLRLCFSLR